MDWILSSPFGSVILLAASSKYLFIISLVAIAAIMNFVVWPAMRRANEMEEIFFTKLREFPTPDDLTKVFAESRKDILEQMRDVLNAHSSKTESTVSGILINFEKFYQKIISYEEEIHELMNNINNMTDEIKEGNESLERDIQVLVKIREEMINLLDNLINEFERTKLIAPIDRTPLERIRYLIKFSDKYVVAMLKKNGMVFENRNQRSGDLNRIFEDSEGKE